MTARAFIGLSVAWPLAVAAVVVFGAAWVALAGAHWFAGLFAEDTDEELDTTGHAPARSAAEGR